AVVFRLDFESMKVGYRPDFRYRVILIVLGMVLGGGPRNPFVDLEEVLVGESAVVEADRHGFAPLSFDERAGIGTVKSPERGLRKIRVKLLGEFLACDLVGGMSVPRPIGFSCFRDWQRLDIFFKI